MLKPSLQQENMMNRIIVLNKIIDKKITQQEAAAILNLSDRHIRRLLIKIKKEGPRGLHRKVAKTKKGFSADFKQKCISAVMFM